MQNIELTFVQIFNSFKWPNIEKIIWPSGHTATKVTTKRLIPKLEKEGPGSPFDSTYFSHTKFGENVNAQTKYF